MKHIAIIWILIILIGCNGKVSDVSNKKLNSRSADSIYVVNKPRKGINLKEYVLIKKETLSMVDFSTTNDIQIYPDPDIIDSANNPKLEYKDYWALFQYDNDLFYLKKIRASKEQYIVATGAGFYRFYTDSEKPLYIFDGINYSEKIMIRGEYLKKYPLRPGELIYSNTINQRTTLFTTGSISKSNNEEFGKPFNIITNFSFNMQTMQNDAFEEVVLFHKDTMYVDGDRYELSFGVDWIGDIDLDGKMDLIMKYSNHHASFEYRLFLSTRNNLKDINDYSARYIYSD